jgi:hypothetical protein
MQLGCELLTALIIPRINVPKRRNPIPCTRKDEKFWEKSMAAKEIWLAMTNTALVIPAATAGKSESGLKTLMNLNKKVLPE